VFTDAQLLSMLPSLHKPELAAAIGRRLLEVQRFFQSGRSSFVEAQGLGEQDFFPLNSGATQFDFENGVSHAFDVYGEQLSLVLLPMKLENNEYATLYPLSEEPTAGAALKSCLGQVCRDVRIWTLKEDFESEEAKEAAVSYVLSSGAELFYCIYLHDDMDSDYLLFRQEVRLEKAATCYSVAGGNYVDPQR